MAQGIFVITEQHDGAFRKVAFETVSEGREGFVIPREARTAIANTCRQVFATYPRVKPEHLTDHIGISTGYLLAYFGYSISKAYLHGNKGIKGDFG